MRTNTKVDKERNKKGRKGQRRKIPTSKPG
jgi:hypothetical protein